MISLILSVSLFLSPSDPVQSTESYEICPCNIHSEQITEIIEKMKLVSIHLSNTRKLGTPPSFAAPQLGYFKRIILIDTAAEDAFYRNDSPNYQIFINPEILWESEEETFFPEMCRTTSNFAGVVPRARKILLKYYTTEGDVYVRAYEDYTARLIQHEIDHLNGIQFPDRVGPEGTLHWVEEKDFSEYWIQWMYWPSYSFEKWLEMKHGNS